MSVSIVANNFGSLSGFFRDLPDEAERSMAMAINQVVARDGLSLIRKDMRDDIEFPAGYLEGKRMLVARKASRGSLEAIIRASDRPTSLARFARAQTPANTQGRGVRVSVKKGETRSLRRAFLVNLRNGNMGLAVRLRPGESLRHSGAAKQLADNLFLLYGPSVDQVFKGAVDDRSRDLLNMVERQFLRQLSRFTSRG